MSSKESRTRRSYRRTNRNDLTLKSRTGDDSVSTSDSDYTPVPVLRAERTIRKPHIRRRRRPRPSTPMYGNGMRQRYPRRLQPLMDVNNLDDIRRSNAISDSLENNTNNIPRRTALLQDRVSRQSNLPIVAADNLTVRVETRDNNNESRVRYRPLFKVFKPFDFEPDGALKNLNHPGTLHYYDKNVSKLISLRVVEKRLMNTISRALR